MRGLSELAPESFADSRAHSYEVLQTNESIVMVLEYLDTELFDYIVKTGKVGDAV